ncbi:MAG: SIMPL domain-containing protein [Cycloclasticus sp.]|nr:SIMPL domain-containing protein [Cycloclasticus sp.]MBQ0789283.1 SIMPL domain-containing protein [Cycloclasticus sp.]
MNKWMLAAALTFNMSFNAVHAHETQPDGLVNLQSNVSITLETDTTIAVMAVEAEHKQPAQLAEQINTTMAWALDAAKKFKSIDVKGGQYSAHQMYDKNVVRSWRGSQQLVLESKNSVELGQLIGLLQTKLLLKSLRYIVSNEKRKKVKTGLIQQAIEQFKQQARVITKSLDHTQYAIHQINIDSNASQPPVHFAQARLLNNAQAVETASANLQPSTSDIQITVSGSIRLIK